MTFEEGPSSGRGTRTLTLSVWTDAGSIKVLYHETFEQKFYFCLLCRPSPRFLLRWKRLFVRRTTVAFGWTGCGSDGVGDYLRGRVYPMCLQGVVPTSCVGVLDSLEKGWRETSWHVGDLGNLRVWMSGRSIWRRISLGLPKKEVWPLLHFV